MRNWKKYYDERPIIKKYKGWNIRKIKSEYYEKYYQKIAYDYICEVRPGVESIRCENIKWIYDWIDKKIKEGKYQKEYIN